MKTWTSTIEVNAGIGDVWHILDGSEEHLRKLDPNIIKNEVIEETPERVGSRYLQEYKEGKRVMSYEVKVLDYNETDQTKLFKIGFNLDGMFEVTARYDITALDENHTRVKYTVTNDPLKLIPKIMMFFMRNDNVMDTHMNRIKELTEAETNH